jgi:imidazoleglycerol-phosphate dehydratase
MTPRSADVERKTRETEVRVRLVVDGSGNARVHTGLGFYDHMLGALAKHARFDLELECRGDLSVDDHHSVEDSALALGEALDRSLGERRGIARFGDAHAPLDEALARAVIDLSGRPFAQVRLHLERERLGEVSTEMLAHALASFATAARLTLHVEVLAGANDHHRCEAAYKAVALALRRAVELDGTSGIPSTKGVL